MSEEIKTTENVAPVNNEAIANDDANLRVMKRKNLDHVRTNAKISKVLGNIFIYIFLIC